MSYESFLEANTVLLISAFVLSVVLGAVVNKTNFCTMGAVSDAVNMGDSGRMRAWLLAIAVALIGVTILEALALVSAGDSFPPYRSNQFIWAENIFGGLLFGIGMTLGSGCGNKTLVRIGGGNIKSIMVFAIIGVIAYFMLNPFPGSDKTLMSVLFIDWIRPLSVELSTGQDLGSVIAGQENAATARLVIGIVLGLALLIFAFKSADFRGNRDNILSGSVVGLAILGAWLITSNITVNLDEEVYTLRDFVQQWEFVGEDEAMEQPADSRPLAPQSYTFINPIGQTVGYISSGFSHSFLTFGLMAVFGVICGSFLWALISRSFRFEWFSSVGDFVNHLVGAILMGFGGTLALGCTIGQGITGLSTLAMGSFLTFFAIVFGSAMTMKVQLYKMVYEDEANCLTAFVTGLADFHLLPNSMRKHDPV